jgi:hypothetical protein
VAEDPAFSARTTTFRNKCLSFVYNITTLTPELVPCKTLFAQTFSLSFPVNTFALQTFRSAQHFLRKGLHTKYTSAILLEVRFILLEVSTKLLDVVSLIFTSVSHSGHLMIGFNNRSVSFFLT